MVNILRKIANRSIKDLLSITRTPSFGNQDLTRQIRFFSKSPKSSIILEIRNEDIEFKINSSTYPDIVISFDLIDILRIVFLSRNNSFDTEVLKISGNSTLEKHTWECLQNLISNNKAILYNLLSDTLICSAICASREISLSSGKTIKYIGKKIENFLT